MPHRWKIVAVAAALIALIGAGPAIGAEKVDTRRLSEYREKVTDLRERADEKLGRAAGGRDILKYGVRTKDGVRPARHEAVKRYQETLKRLISPPPPPVAVEAAYGAGSTSSGGAYDAPSAGGGGYCGLLQFDQQTWESVGGSGSPCAASPEEQIHRGEILRSRRGNQPWPVCGQNGASLEQIIQCESGGDPNARG